MNSSAAGIVKICGIFGGIIDHITRFMHDEQVLNLHLRIRKSVKFHMCNNAPINLRFGQTVLIPPLNDSRAHILLKNGYPCQECSWCEYFLKVHVMRQQQRETLSHLSFRPCAPTSDLAPTMKCLQWE